MVRPIVIVRKAVKDGYRWECQETDCGDIDYPKPRSQSYSRARTHVANTGHEVEVIKIMAYVGRGDTLGYDDATR